MKRCHTRKCRCITTLHTKQESYFFSQSFLSGIGAFLKATCSLYESLKHMKTHLGFSCQSPHACKLLNIFSNWESKLSSSGPILLGNVYMGIFIYQQQCDFFFPVLTAKKKTRSELQINKNQDFCWAVSRTSFVYLSSPCLFLTTLLPAHPSVHELQLAGGEGQDPADVVGDTEGE